MGWRERADFSNALKESDRAWQPGRECIFILFVQHLGQWSPDPDWGFGWYCKISIKSLTVEMEGETDVGYGTESVSLCDGEDGGIIYQGGVRKAWQGQ